MNTERALWTKRGGAAHWWHKLCGNGGGDVSMAAVLDER
jgi:hypothetical protein